MAPTPPLPQPDRSTEQQVQHASLTGLTGSRLDFHFNPAKMQLTRTTTTQNATNVIGTTFEETLRASGKLTISMSGIVFVGDTCKEIVDLLLAWTIPKPDPGSGSNSRSFDPTKILPFGGGGGGGGGDGQSESTSKSTTDAGKGAPVDYVLEKLNFQWGAKINYVVTLERVTANHDRFAADGTPLRTSVDLMLKEYTDPKKFTNPTSGGLPGRTMHTVTGGERLAQIAQAAYGTPDAWRALAMVNRLDDPLRLVPGRQLYLPGPGELAEEGARS